MNQIPALRRRPHVLILSASSGAARAIVEDALGLLH
jgi:hypothetical protein